eukprot:TRINITY_DN65688_c0_g1_i2.p1 TRINITY_DN65688_c0_g1~~TRINITY_DN65688_c0_g1_i2.p1  ORF type:complete len:391 (-),score=105.48 TRINITY_DN65688_c0_g1_i2:156-1328(-)
MIFGSEQPDVGSCWQRCRHTSAAGRLRGAPWSPWRCYTRGKSEAGSSCRARACGKSCLGRIAPEGCFRCTAGAALRLAERLQDEFALLRKDVSRALEDITEIRAAVHRRDAESSSPRQAQPQQPPEVRSSEQTTAMLELVESAERSLQRMTEETSRQLKEQAGRIQQQFEDAQRELRGVADLRTQLRKELADEMAQLRSSNAAAKSQLEALANAAGEKLKSLVDAASMEASAASAAAELASGKAAEAAGSAASAASSVISAVAATKGEGSGAPQMAAEGNGDSEKLERFEDSVAQLGREMERMTLRAQTFEDVARSLARQFDVLADEQQNCMNAINAFQGGLSEVNARVDEVRAAKAAGTASSERLGAGGARRPPVRAGTHPSTLNAAFS